MSKLSHSDYAVRQIAFSPLVRLIRWYRGRRKQDASSLLSTEQPALQLLHEFDLTAKYGPCTYTLRRQR